MLNQDAVNEDEERLRILVGKLTEDSRKYFYFEAKRRIKDPDTYAALNWFFVTGIHHFYLGKWAYGILDLFLFFSGLALIFFGYQVLGFTVIIFITLAEVWALFRSQIIIQDWNNRIYQNILNDIDSKNTYNRVAEGI